jgi:hypothetical protein
MNQHSAMKSNPGISCMNIVIEIGNVNSGFQSQLNRTILRKGGSCQEDKERYDTISHNWFSSLRAIQGPNLTLIDG